MKPTPLIKKKGFTLLETVIAIGVLAVLLSGFLVVFAPAAAGIRQSINSQQADRLASALEEEMATLRAGEAFTPPAKTSFDKAFNWLLRSDSRNDAILVYQYRGKVGDLRQDGTPEPEPNIDGKFPGTDFVLMPMARRLSDSEFKNDLKAIDGSVYLIKPTQLIFTGTDGMKLGKRGQIVNPKPNGTPADPNYKPGPFTDPNLYSEAVIAFAAEFHIMPSKDISYFNGTAFTKKFAEVKNPVFTRNLAVRR